MKILKMKSFLWEITSDLRTSVCYRGFHWWWSGKESVCLSGIMGSVVDLERSPEEGMATHSSIPV